MSVSASIGLRIRQFGLTNTISQTKTLKLLISHGWNLVNPDGEVSYLPPGDDDNFNYIHSKISVPSLMRILEEKEQKGELIGVTLTWQDTFIGGDLFLWSEKEALEKKIHTPMSFGLDINRKTLTNQDNFEMTDVNWYLERLLPIFNQNNMRVEYFTYQEHI